MTTTCISRGARRANSNDDSDTTRNRQQELHDAACGLRYLATAGNFEREDNLTSDEGYGMYVLLNMIADKVDGRAA